MRVGVLVPVLVLFGCASTPKRSHAPILPQPDMDGVVRLVGRFSSAHACPFGDGSMAFTAAHVVDYRPFEKDVPAFPQRWSDGDGHSGVIDPVVVFQSSDLAVIKRRDGKPFDRAYQIAARPPLPGDRVFILGYDRSKKRAAMAPELTEGRVIRRVADYLVIDENSKPGSSGSCVLNERSEIVGIVAWAREYPDGEVGITVGLWSGIEELDRLKAVLAGSNE